MASDYDLLIAKLDGFIRKYYKDRLIRGVLYSVGLLVLFFLMASLGEYFGKFGTGVRTGLFWLLALVTAVVLVRFIAIPLVKLFRLGPVITHEEAPIPALGFPTTSCICRVPGPHPPPAVSDTSNKSGSRVAIGLCWIGTCLRYASSAKQISAG